MRDGRVFRLAMAVTSAKMVHIETALGLFHILGAEILDPETIVATYGVTPELAEDTLKSGDQLGYFAEVTDGAYRLTPRGKRQNEKRIMRRGGAALRPSAD